MNRKSKAKIILAATVISSIFVFFKLKKANVEANTLAEEKNKRVMGIYERYIKRKLDIAISFCAILVLLPVYFVLIILGTIFMRGNPFFTQERPGLNEKIFKMIKFRTMDNRKDKEGNLLPDEVRLNKYGRFLRSTSLDELPELFNILKGDMSLVGPRPQLVRDMVFMTNEQRKRHEVLPGLSGLAQVSGRNAISWEDKLEYDLQYISDISLFKDIKIIIKTLFNVLKREGITEEGLETADDFGVYLLKNGKINFERYEILMRKSELILKGEV